MEFIKIIGKVIIFIVGGLIGIVLMYAIYYNLWKKEKNKDDKF